MNHFRNMIIPEFITKAETALICVWVSGEDNLTMSEIRKIINEHDLFTKIDMSLEQDPAAIRTGFAGAISNHVKTKNSILLQIEDANGGVHKFGPSKFADSALIHIFGPRYNDLRGFLTHKVEQGEVDEFPTHAAEIDDPQFLVTLTLDTADSGVMVREFLMNGVEAPNPTNMPAKYVRTIEIDQEVFEAPKLTITNNGQGMDADELVRMMYLATNLGGKSKGTMGRQNHGEGAKYAAARFNRDGILTVSRKGNGPVNCVMFKFNEAKNHYGMVYGGDGRCVWEVPDEGYPKGDFVRVVLMGNDAIQNTAIQPYGRTDEKHVAVREVWNRFYSFPKPNGGSTLKVIATAAVSGRGEGRATRDLLAQADLQARHPEHFRTAKVALLGYPGVFVEFVQTFPLRDGSGGTIYSQASLGENGSRMALVWRNEMYDVRRPKQWQLDAATYGLGPVASKVGVFIHLPDVFDTVKDDRSRRRLERDGNPLLCSEFRDAIYLARPDWLKKMVDDAFAQSSSTTSVKGYLDDLALELRPQKPDPQGSNEVRERSTSERGGGGGKPGIKRHAPPRSTGANSGYPLIPPNVIWTTPTAIPNLHGRGAFYINATNTLYLNECYSFKGLLLNHVQANVIAGKKFIRNDESMSIIYDLANSEAQNHIGRRVGEMVLRAKAKAGEEHWTINQIEEAVQPSALTIIYETANKKEIVDAVMDTDQYKDTMTGLSAGKRKAA